MIFPARTGKAPENVERGGISVLTGEIENRSVKKIQITGQCDLLNLEDADGSRNEFQKARCARVGRKSG